MDWQLHLLSDEAPGEPEPGEATRRPTWQLDAKTRATGMRGLARARAALRAARSAAQPTSPDAPDPEATPGTKRSAA